MQLVLAALVGAFLVAALVWAQRRWFSFVAQRPEDYAATGPLFDIRETLAGRLVCEGVIYGPRGRVISRFVADMEGTWSGNSGTLTERFRYDSGSTQTRAWHLSLGENGRIRAEADDIVGTGAGAQSGGTVHLRYRIRLPSSAGGHVLDTTDWMYLVEDGTVVNRSQFRKFGITVAELVATVRKAT